MIYNNLNNLSSKMSQFSTWSCCLDKNSGDKNRVKELNVDIDKDMDKDIDILSEKVNKLVSLKEEVYQKFFEVRKECYDLTDKFLSKYKAPNSMRLGKLESYLDSGMDRLTLIDILGSNACREDVSSLFLKLKRGSQIDHHWYSSNSELLDFVSIKEKNEIIMESYSNIVKDIDSMEFYTDSTDMPQLGCLIGSTLRELLEFGYKLRTSYKPGKTGKTDETSFYVVIFNFLRSKENDGVRYDIIYNYTQYNKNFLDLFYLYISIQQASMIIHNNYNIGSSYFFCMDSKLKKDISYDYESLKLKALFSKYFDVRDSKRNSKPLNFVDLCKLCVKGTLIEAEMDHILGNISLLLHRDSYELLSNLYYLSGDSRNENVLVEYEKMIKGNRFNLSNHMSRFIYIVSDLKGFTNGIEERLKNFEAIKSVNSGSQKFRGSTSYLNSILSRLDKDFRDSMYKHNLRFLGDKALKKSKFSFKNVHMNIGHVRWYSTVRCIFPTSLNNSPPTFNMWRANRSFHTSNISKSKFNVYSELKYFLDNNPINDETQIKIERFLLKNGIEELKETHDIKIGGLYSGLYSKKTSEFLLHIKPDLLNKIKGFMKFKKNYKNETSKKAIYKLYLVDIIENVGISYTLTILLGRYIKILSNTKYNYSYEKNLVLDIALDLSKDLIRQYLLILYKRRLEDLAKKDDSDTIKEYTFSDWKKDRFDLFQKYEDSEVKVSIGVLLIEWLEDCNLINKKLVKLSSTQHNVYSAPDNLVTLWENSLKTETLIPSTKSESIIKPVNMLLTSPFRLPSIVKPKQYIYSGDRVELGGYLLNDTEYADPLILKNHTLDKESIIHKKNYIYDVVNKLNSIGYKVNTQVLNFINNNPNLYKDVLLNENHPLTEKDRLTKKDKNILQTHTSKLEQQNHILSIANLFSDVTEFFFVNRIDNRGRLYCVTEYFNYQSTELAKSLLLFSKPNPVYRFGNESGLLFFKAYGGNCFGNKIDKLSTKDKNEWVDLNSEDIINFENGKLIKQADNKFLFTAFCIEFKKWSNFYHNSSDSFFNTHLPIQLDASCNGFQHLVLLSGEMNLRRQLNLTEAYPSDTPWDFYSYVLELLKDYLDDLNMDCLEDEEKNSYERINNFCLDRKLIKNMIMTIPYNATPRKIVNDMTDFLSRKKIKNGDVETEWFIYPNDLTEKKLSYKDLFLLVSSIKKVLDKIAPKITKLKNYLHKIAEVCTILEIHIPWLLPTGLEVRQSYLEEKTVKIKPFSYSKTQLNLTTFIKKLDLAKQTRSFMPNLIHSLDAASLILLLNEYLNSSELKTKNIFTIHDCFAVPMNHIEFIMDNLRKIYTMLYSDSHYLKQLDEGILNVISYHYRDVEINRDENKLVVIQNNDRKEFFYPNIKEVLGENLPTIDKNIHYIIK